MVQQYNQILKENLSGLYTEFIPKTSISLNGMSMMSNRDKTAKPKPV
jgi:hypothetical protein